MKNTPNLVGRTIDELPTPALVVELDRLEYNLASLSALLADAPIRIRPHAKAHKCVEIAQRQITLGAVGICCQTVAEAEAFAAGGINDILLTNQILDPAKIARLAAIPGRVRLGICVDSMRGLELIAAGQPPRAFDVYIEVDVGGGRCGVTEPDAVVAIARRICTSGLSFAGLQAYNGRIQHVNAAAERAQATCNTAAATRIFVDALNNAGLRPAVVSGGGTGTIEFDRFGDVLTEVQCGSYALMDVDYLTLHSAAPTTFEPALTVLTSVISASDAHAVVDAGLKAVAIDSGPPIPRDFAQVGYGNPSDEHGVLRSNDGSPLPPIGSRVHLIPGHCDPTVALHEKMYAVRSGVVHEIWPIVARGIW